MNFVTMILTAAALCVVAFAAALFASGHSLRDCAEMLGRERILALNALGDNTTPNGSYSLFSDAAITTRHLLVKRGSDAKHAAVISAASDEPLGVCFDEASAAEEAIGVQSLGVRPNTVPMVAQGTIAADVDVYSYGNGKVTTEPSTAGTYWKVGKSRTASSAGLVIEVEPCQPRKLVVLALPGNTDSEFANLTISASYAQAEVQALRTKCEELADDFRALAGALASGSTDVKFLAS